MPKKIQSIKSSVKDKNLVEVRRREIVNAAVDLFVKKGFHKTTVREIARRFGMSVGTLYEYISTKEDILFLVCDYIHTSFSSRIRPSLEISSDNTETLKRAIRIYFQIADEMQDYIIFLYQETKSLPKDTQKYIFDAENEMTGLFEEILLKGMMDGSFTLDKNETRLIAHNIMVLGQMWAFRRWVIQKNYTLERYIEIQTGVILSKISL